jgi:hypothetical protein
MAQNWLSEARCAALSKILCTDAAFDAAYMFCRCVMNGSDDALEHPHQDVLTGAAMGLGWDPVVMKVAAHYLQDWHWPYRGEGRYDQLMALALMLEAAALQCPQDQPG